MAFILLKLAFRMPKNRHLKRQKKESFKHQNWCLTLRNGPLSKEGHLLRTQTEKNKDGQSKNQSSIASICLVRL